ncbi:epoxyqueuosine reductase [Bacillota bacterium LX-D]|nr:epoxyqueuosine reductase [Bacillota bacterium LX-D]
MEKLIAALLKNYIKEYHIKNNLKEFWSEPLLAYADSRDKLFTSLKEIVSPEHRLPTDVLPEAKSVITYFIPFEKSIVESNIPTSESSREWGLAYLYTNQLILDANNFIKNKLAKLGYIAIVTPATHDFDENKLISNWSHRHIAYIAGLGTFGLNNMLITEKGSCGRIGSIITDLELKPTPRQEMEFCLYKQKGICKQCVKRCINGALQIDSYDRKKCYEMCLKNADNLANIGFADVCGKCLVKLPCSTQKPFKENS